jgi:transcriptional regulator with XRE-family HTH domain
VRPAEWQAIVQAFAHAGRELRYMLGWSQQQVADLARTSQGAVSRLEAGGCADMSLHTIVLVFRALAAGLVAHELPPSPETQRILAFVEVFDPTFTLTEPLDRGLLVLVRLYHEVPAGRRRALVQLVTAAVALGEPATGGPDGDSPDLLLRQS